MRASLLPAVLILLVAGCADPADTGSPANDVLKNAGAPTDIDTLGAENMESEANLSVPDPAVAVPSAEAGPADARSIVTAYFDAVSAKRYEEAYALWEPDAAGMSEAAFAASFAKYRSYTAEIGVPGRIDSGAGQRYVQVPVRITAVLAGGGEEVTMIGPVTLHRTADIDGSTAAQRSWRIRATAFKPRAPTRAPIEATYRCDGGVAFDVRFDNDANSAAIALSGEEPVVLAGQRPASGIWYAAEGWELRGKGNAATLTRPGRGSIECQAGDPAGSGGAGDGSEGDETP